MASVENKFEQLKISIKSLKYSGCIIWESAWFSAEGYFKTVSHQDEAEVGINCRFTVVGDQPMLLWLFYVHPVVVSTEQSNAFKIKLKVPNWKPLFIFRLQETPLCCISGFFIFNGEESTWNNYRVWPPGGDTDLWGGRHKVARTFYSGKICRISSQRKVVKINKPFPRRGALSVDTIVLNRIDTLHVESRRQHERGGRTRTGARARLPQPQPWRDVLFLPLVTVCWEEEEERVAFVDVPNTKQVCFRYLFCTPTPAAHCSTAERWRSGRRRGFKTGFDWSQMSGGWLWGSASVAFFNSVAICHWLLSKDSVATRPSVLWCRLPSVLRLHRPCMWGSHRSDVLHPENRISLLPRKAKTPPFFPVTRSGRRDARRPPCFVVRMARSNVGAFSPRLPRRRWCLK